MNILAIDFVEIFKLETSIAELVIRGSFFYIALLFLLRILPRRTGGELEMMDLVFILLITEAAAHSLGDYKSVTDGIIVILTMMSWSYLMNVLSFHFPFFEKLIKARALPIVKDGKLLRKNMRREYLTVDELWEHLHQEGIDDLSKIKIARVEGEGKISVVLNEK